MSDQHPPQHASWYDGVAAERARIIAWLRDEYETQLMRFLAGGQNSRYEFIGDDWEDAADAIERGEHEERA